MSCNFMSCNFDGPSFSCQSFSVNPSLGEEHAWLADSLENMLLPSSGMCYHIKFRRHSSKRSGVGMVQKFWACWARSLWDRGVPAPTCRNKFKYKNCSTSPMSTRWPNNITVHDSRSRFQMPPPRDVGVSDPLEICFSWHDIACLC